MHQYHCMMDSLAPLALTGYVLVTTDSENLRPEGQLGTNVKSFVFYTGLSRPRPTECVGIRNFSC